MTNHINTQTITRRDLTSEKLKQVFLLQDLGMKPSEISRVIKEHRYAVHNPYYGRKRFNALLNRVFESWGERISSEDKKSIKDDIRDKLPLIFKYVHGRSFEGFIHSCILLSSKCMLDTKPLTINESRAKYGSVLKYCKLLRLKGIYPMVCKLTPEMVLYYNKKRLYDAMKKKGDDVHGDDFESVFEETYEHAKNGLDKRGFKQRFSGVSPYNLAFSHFFYSYEKLNYNRFPSWSVIVNEKLNITLASVICKLREFEEFYQHDSMS